MMLLANRPPTQYTVHTPPQRAAFRPKILCATDLSSKSEYAVARAMNLSEALGGRTLLLHVVGNDVPLRLAGRRADRAHSALQWHARQFAHLRVKPELSVRLGPPYATIARAALSWGADLVVLGLHRSRSNNPLVWATAERIAHRVRRPVLVINTDAKRDYTGVTFVAGRNASLGVQLADQFDLLSTAHLSVVPFLRVRERAALRLSQWSRGNPALAERLKSFADRTARATLEDAGLHLLGFEILNANVTPRAVMSLIKKGKKPQLLVAGVSRNPLQLRSLPRLSALTALRTRACDVLLFPERSARDALRAAPFSAESVAST